jgi:hypothetical protein
VLRRIRESEPSSVASSKDNRCRVNDGEKASYNKFRLLERARQEEKWWFPCLSLASFDELGGGHDSGAQTRDDAAVRLDDERVALIARTMR